MIEIKDDHLVSVIIPVYNGEKYLAESIETVLGQPYQPLEIIVVDDGSSDNTAEIVRGFTGSVRYCFQTNNGCAAARNQGIELAQGNFLAFLDADDLWVKDKLALQMAAFDEDPQLDIVFGQVKQFHSPELDETVKAKIHCPTALMPGYIPSALLIKRESFLRVGYFETNWQLGEFISWYIRTIELGLSMKMLQEMVVRRRLHQTNQGVSKRDDLIDYVRILKTTIDRRRAKLKQL